MNELIKEISIIVGTPIIRSCLGWAQKVLVDNRVSRLEWKLLVSTIFRVGLIAGCQLAIVKGVNIDIGIVESFAIGGAAILTDKLFGAIKDNNNVTRR